VYFFIVATRCNHVITELANIATENQDIPISYHSTRSLHLQVQETELTPAFLLAPTPRGQNPVTHCFSVLRQLLAFRGTL
jgi:hypothetical protein